MTEPPMVLPKARMRLREFYRRLIPTYSSFQLVGNLDSHEQQHLPPRRDQRIYVIGCAALGITLTLAISAGAGLVAYQSIISQQSLHNEPTVPFIQNHPSVEKSPLPQHPADTSSLPETPQKVVPPCKWVDLKNCSFSCSSSAINAESLVCSTTSDGKCSTCSDLRNMDECRRGFFLKSSDSSTVLSLHNCYPDGLACRTMQETSCQIIAPTSPSRSSPSSAPPPKASAFSKDNEKHLSVEKCSAMLNDPNHIFRRVRPPCARCYNILKSCITR